MAINFPDNPNANDVFTDGGKSWIWDGTTWKIYSSSTSGIGLNNLSVTNASVGTSTLSYNNTTGVFTYTPPDLSGYITTQYTLPTASTTVLGGVKVDGSTITINGSGVISGANTYSLPTASTTVLGGVKVDGTTITINNGVISSADPVPTNITVTNESTDTTCFPLFTTTATGNLAPKTVTSLKLNSQTGQVEAGSFKKTGGSSSEFLKADGSIDSSTIPTATSQLTNDSGFVTSATGGVPVGTIVMYGGSTAPSGWQLCDGSTPQTTALQTLLGGAGQTVPNLKDKFIVGAGNNYALKATGGSADATLVSHSHTTNSTSKTLTGAVTKVSECYNVAGGASGVFTKTNDGNSPVTGGSSNSPTSGFTFDGTHSHDTNSQGSSATNANLPPYYALTYIIKY